jgi:hypothetical protein
MSFRLEHISVYALNRLAEGLQRAVKEGLHREMDLEQAQTVLARSAGYADWWAVIRPKRVDAAAPFRPNALSDATLKQLVKGLRKALADELDQAVPQHQAQTVLAMALGFPHWHAALQRKAAKTTAPSARGSGFPEGFPVVHAPRATPEHSGLPGLPIRAATVSKAAAQALNEAFDLAAWAGASGISLGLLNHVDPEASAGDLLLWLCMPTAEDPFYGLYAEDFAGWAHAPAQAKAKRDFVLAPGVEEGALAEAMEAWEEKHWELVLKDPDRFTVMLDHATLRLSDRAYWLSAVAGLPFNPGREPEPALAPAPGSPTRKRRGPAAP